jgi:hypothetical protein
VRVRTGPPSDLFDNLGDLEPRLGTMHDLEHGEAAVDKNIFRRLARGF